MTDWSEVRRTTKETHRLRLIYYGLNSENRSDSALVKQARDEYWEAWRAQQAALVRVWEDEDGINYRGYPRLSRTLHRYYAWWQAKQKKKPKVKRKAQPG